MITQKGLGCREAQSPEFNPYPVSQQENVGVAPVQMSADSEQHSHPGLIPFPDPWSSRRAFWTLFNHLFCLTFLLLKVGGMDRSLQVTDTALRIWGQNPDLLCWEQSSEAQKPHSGQRHVSWRPAESSPN